MAFRFTPPKGYRYKAGDLFLGLDPDTNQPTGIATDRHAMTIAGARSGKGVALIIPNLLRWPESAVTIDPKGEAAAATWEAREAMGQAVGVVDPFHVAAVPDRLRVAINPLALIDPTSWTARADIEIIADGLVKRSDTRHAQWDDGTAAILAGIIAFAVADAPPEHRTLTAMRQILLQPNGDPQGEKATGLYADAQSMLDCDACGGLAKTAGNMIMTALESDRGIEKECLAQARRVTAWLDDPPFAAALSASTFDLAALKSGRASLFLVLPPDYLATKGEFLRLFVRCALSVMAKGPPGSGGRCLFLLDEFYSLGRLDIIAKAAGLMPGYGVHLWPVLQDLGQLVSLYGPEASETFFGNADAHIFFGNSDRLTLEYVSQAIGVKTTEDIGVAPPSMVELVSASYRAQAAAPVLPPTPMPQSPALQKGILGVLTAAGGMLESSIYAHNVQRQAQIRAEIEGIDRAQQMADSNAMREYQHAMQAKGERRITPDEMKALVAKEGQNRPARSMLVLTGAGHVLNLRLAPYFEPAPPILLSEEEKRIADTIERAKKRIVHASGNVNQIIENEEIYNSLYKKELGFAFKISVVAAGFFYWFFVAKRGGNPWGLLLIFPISAAICYAIHFVDYWWKRRRTKAQAIEWWGRLILACQELWDVGEYMTDAELEPLGYAGNKIKSWQEPGGLALPKPGGN